MVDGLAVIRRRPDSPSATVVLVHGAMDRAASFGRTMRRLESMDVLAYDRRGYAGSLGAGAARSMEDHVGDLRTICEWAGPGGSPIPLILVGHSLGGLITLLAADNRDRGIAFDNLGAVGAYEAPMPWETATDAGLAGNAALAVGRREGPSAAAEYFYRAMVGDAVWERLGANARSDRLAEGPALLSDLEHSREATARPEVDSIEAQVYVARGQQSSQYLRDLAGGWAERLGVAAVELAGAGHGAHLSHPGEFAGWIRSVATGGED